MCAWQVIGLSFQFRSYRYWILWMLSWAFLTLLELTKKQKAAQSVKIKQNRPQRIEIWWPNGKYWKCEIHKFHFLYLHHLCNHSSVTFQSIFWWDSFNMLNFKMTYFNNSLFFMFFFRDFLYTFKRTFW